MEGDQLVIGCLSGYPACGGVQDFANNDHTFTHQEKFEAVVALMFNYSITDAIAALYRHHINNKPSPDCKEKILFWHKNFVYRGSLYLGTIVNPENMGLMNYENKMEFKFVNRKAAMLYFDFVHQRSMSEARRAFENLFPDYSYPEEKDLNEMRNNLYRHGVISPKIELLKDYGGAPVVENKFGNPYTLLVACSMHSVMTITKYDSEFNSFLEMLKAKSFEVRGEELYRKEPEAENMQRSYIEEKNEIIQSNNAISAQPDINAEKSKMIEFVTIHDEEPINNNEVKQVFNHIEAKTNSNNVLNYSNLPQIVITQPLADNVCVNEKKITRKRKICLKALKLVRPIVDTNSIEDPTGMQSTSFTNVQSNLPTEQDPSTKLPNISTLLSDPRDLTTLTNVQNACQAQQEPTKLPLNTVSKVHDSREAQQNIGNLLTGLAVPNNYSSQQNLGNLLSTSITNVQTNYATHQEHINLPSNASTNIQTDRQFNEDPINFQSKIVPIQYNCPPVQSDHLQLNVSRRFENNLLLPQNPNCLQVKNGPHFRKNVTPQIGSDNLQPNSFFRFPNNWMAYHGPDKYELNNPSRYHNDCRTQHEPSKNLQANQNQQMQGNWQQHPGSLVSNVSPRNQINWNNQQGPDNSQPNRPRMENNWLSQQNSNNMLSYHEQNNFTQNMNNWPQQFHQNALQNIPEQSDQKNWKQRNMNLHPKYHQNNPPNNVLPEQVHNSIPLHTEQKNYHSHLRPQYQHNLLQNILPTRSSVNAIQSQPAQNNQNYVGPQASPNDFFEQLCSNTLAQSDSISNQNPGELQNIPWSDQQNAYNYLTPYDSNFAKTRPSSQGNYNEDGPSDINKHKSN